MPKFKKGRLLRLSAIIACVVILIAMPLMAKNLNSDVSADDDFAVLYLWQIDGFEGGKGSRANYLQDIGDKFFKAGGCYLKVTSLSADAARENLKAGNVPDLISYAAGMYGIETYITGGAAYSTWCHGGYCFLCLEQNADFLAVSPTNTIINAGTDNRAEVCALFCGIQGAETARPTAAYVKLIDGKYKFMLGTQRDVFRLRTRGVQFSIKPVTEFNDLYQNISVTATNAKKRQLSESFIKFLLSKSENVTKLGLLAQDLALYADELHALENLSYEFTIKSPISEQAKKQIDSATANCDVNLLKNLLK